MQRLCPALFISCFFVVSCAETETTLLIELVPNPEVNTRSDVAEHINRVEVVFEAEGGFSSLDAENGDTWGSFSVVDRDEDGVMELLLSRPGRRALEAFAISQGSQGDRVIVVTARGMSTEEDEVTALGVPTKCAFQNGLETRVEVPFNLVPEYKPLRVLSMSPSPGSRDLTSPVTLVTIRIGGEVLDTALDGQVEIHAVSVDEHVEPELSVSYVETGMGRLTNLRIQDCMFHGGEYVVILGTEICSRTGRCLDQELGLDGAQPFRGEFSVGGDPEPLFCEPIGILSGTCPDVPCDPGYECEAGVCVPDVETTPEYFPGEEIECDPESCGPVDVAVCDPLLGCVPSCVIYGACVDPTQTCDLETGLCSEE